MRKLLGSLHRQTWAEIDLGKIRRNFSKFRALVPGEFICPMVKADAYGHGSVEVAKALAKEGATHLGVSLVEEALRLREAGIREDVLIFGLFEGKESARAVIEGGFTPVVSEWNQLEEIAAEKPANKTKIHLKFNTGMNRLGFGVENAPKLREWVDQNPAFELEGIATHLMRGEDAGAIGGESESQLALFAQVLAFFQGLNLKAHALNSSGSINMSALIKANKPLSKGAFFPFGSRPGIGIYGIAPDNDEKIDIGLEPVLSLVSHLVEVREIPKGEKVSYGATWRASRPSVIGVVPIGYADGVSRLLSNRGSVLCRGARAKIAGIVCMDLFMIDLTDIVAKTGPITRGEEIIMIGDQAGQAAASEAKGIILASEIADLVGTIPYEVLTSVAQRVPRIYLQV